MKKRVILIGGRNKVKSLAVSLINRGYKVAAVNKNIEDCMKLTEINKLTVFQGDGTKPYVLEDVGAFEYDIAIALTPNDEDNLVICELCKKRFNVEKTVSLVSDPKKTDFFYKLGIDSVVCAISAVTGIIEQQAFVEEMATLIPVGEGKVKIAEVAVTNTSPAAGKKIWEINLPRDVIVGSILRGDKVMVPRGDTRILEGDLLVVISGNGQEMAAIKELTGR